MEAAEKDCSILGSLFQTIVNDLRNSTPIWEDFAYKATKLSQCLKTTLVAISSFLDAFQKVADMATNSKGATKEIGTALTRLCMRHKSIETCLKQLTSSILDSMVAPLQERLEDWKKVVAQLDKDHAKEYKKARHEIKKAASDTMRLQKKVRKGTPHGKNEMQNRLDVAMQDVNARYHQLEEMEKNSVRTALIEERSRFCLFITCIKPFVDHEVHLLTEVTHLQEIMHSLCLQAADPQSLPPASEQVITDIKGMDPATLNLHPHVKQHPSPPSSPSSLGSRKSSMCSINSINSSSSGSSKSHSPSHTMHKRTASQASNSSDQDAADCDSTPTTPSANATTPTPSSSGSSSSTSLPSVASPMVRKMERVRPHTISAGSEKLYSRPALKPELFEPLPEKGEPEGVEMREGRIAGGKARSLSAAVGGGGHHHLHHHQQGARQSATINKMQPVLPPHCPRPKVKAVAPPSLPPGAQPVYANTMDLQRMALENQIRQQHDRETTAATNRHSAQPSTQGELSEDCAVNALNLEEAIRSLDTITTALVTDMTEEEAAAAVAAEREAAEKKELEEIEMRRASRSQKQMQQNSLELAAAIRELEESTAALNSTYDSASHTSLHCSSGYATMNSTPSGSEDTIASGGVPASGANASHKGAGGSPRPPPPVRRTASISTSSSGSGGGPTAQRKTDSGMSYPGGSGGTYPGQIEGPYAELQLIQQTIQQQQKKKQQQPAPLPKPGQLQRQLSGESPHHHMSSPSPDRVSVSSESSSGSGHYAVPSLVSPGSASVIQSLNAKFASLNQQYQEPSSGGGTYVGGEEGIRDPTAASLMPPPPAPAKGQGPGKTRTPPTHHPPPPGSIQHLQSLPESVGQGHSSRPRESGNLHAQLQQQGEGEEFPLPPTAEELAAMETMYAHPHLDNPPPPTTHPKPRMSSDLMSELKRRMSAEEASDV